MLYAVERRADEETLSFEERSELRSRLSYPIMVAFEKWMVSEYPKVLPKGRIGKAIYYTYKMYHKLTRYHLDGRLKMDNNLGENAIRPVAMGRKCWLVHFLNHVHDYDTDYSKNLDDLLPHCFHAKNSENLAILS